MEMTGVLFCGLLVSLGAITTLFVEFLKSVFDGYKKTYNAQTISLISGVVTGIVGTTMVYIVMGIPFTPVNIVFIVFETIGVMIGAQLGYDKVVSVIKQAFIDHKNANY